MINEVQHHRPRSSDLPEPGASGATPKVRARNEVEAAPGCGVPTGQWMGPRLDASAQCGIHIARLVDLV